MSDKNNAVARRFFEEVYSQGKLELVEELMAPDYVARVPAATLKGLEAVKRSIASKPPSIQCASGGTNIRRDKVVSRLAFSAEGESWVGVAIQRFVNGKIAETWRLTNNPLGQR